MPPDERKPAPLVNGTGSGDLLAGEVGSNGTACITMDTRPYATGAALYFDAGWRGVLPVPAGRKGPPPTGFTGRCGADPSWADIQTWIDDTPGANIALHMPPGVLGVDVDSYGGKPGAATLAECEARWGALPPTWTSANRADGASGIRFYGVPPRLDWIGGLAGIDLVHAGHRYAMVAPSIHPEGRPYYWLNPENAVSAMVPDVANLPALPDQWVQELSSGVHVDSPSVDAGHHSTAEGWIAAAPEGPPCAVMASRANKVSPGGRHDGMASTVLALMRLAEEGHTGLTAVLDQLRGEFIAAVTGDHSRTDAEAGREFDRALVGAVVKVESKPGLAAGTAGDPCGWSASTPTAGDASTVPVVATDAPPPATEQALPVPRHKGAGTGNTAIERGGALFFDVAGLLSGGLPDPPKPLILTRDDGHAIFYGGQVNSLFGESESGKTFIALAAIAEVAKAGDRAAFIDIDHNGAAAIVARLMALGVPADYLGNPEQFRYWEPADKAELGDLVAYMVTWKPAVVVVDSVGELLPLFGLNSNSPDDFTAVHTGVLKPMAMADSAVIIIDHLAKGTESKAAGPTGTAAKKRAVGGVSIRVTVHEQFVPGDRGSAWLAVNKDRHGGLRQHCGRGDREPSAGLFTLTAEGDHLVWNISAPKDTDGAEMIGVPQADLDALTALKPPPESVRDVARRMSWGSNKATKTLGIWRSGSATEKRGNVSKTNVPGSYTPMSGNGEHSPERQLSLVTVDPDAESGDDE